MNKIILFILITLSFKAIAQQDSSLEIKSIGYVNNKYPYGLKFKVSFVNRSNKKNIIPKTLHWGFYTEKDTSFLDIICLFEKYKESTGFKNCEFDIHLDDIYNTEEYLSLNPLQESKAYMFGTNFMFNQSDNGLYRGRLKYQFPILGV